MKNKLKDVLFNRNISIEKLSIDLQIGKTTLYQIVNLKSTPSVKYALKIAKYLNISVEELFLSNEN